MAVHEFSLTLRQLELLYGRAQPQDGQLALYTKQPYRLELFEPTAFRDAAEWASKVAHDTDVYHVVNLLSPSACALIRSRAGRGQESELESVVALVAEIDAAGTRHAEADYPPHAAALKALECMPLPPSIVNLSGPDDGGLHVYWALEQPVRVAGDEARAAAKAISRGWQERLRRQLSPYRLDSTYDLVRVLRIAGCPNHKYVDAVTRPLLVEDRRYRLDDFAAHVEIEPPQPATEQRDIDEVSNCWRVARCRAYLECVPDAVSGSHGHDKTFRAACECARFGLSQADAMQVMLWFNDIKTPAGDKWTAAELEHKLASAFETVERQGQFGTRLGA